MRVTTVLRTTEESTAASGYQVSASTDMWAVTMGRRQLPRVVIGILTCQKALG